MKDRCTPLVNCSCDEPKNWRTQTISLTNLEKVEMKRFEGEDHEFDFLKLIFRCAPMLKTVALELSECSHQMMIGAKKYTTSSWHILLWNAALIIVLVSRFHAHALDADFVFTVLSKVIFML